MFPSFVKATAEIVPGINANIVQGSAASGCWYKEAIEQRILFEYNLESGPNLPSNGRTSTYLLPSRESVLIDSL